jgi:hypothetical protein
LICSTSNPTDTVAQAIGMSASDLRVALVSGQSVSEVAADKNVDMQTIIDALTTQRQTDLDQALADGLLTQEQHDAIIQAMQNAPALNGSRQLEIRVPEHNVVNREQAVADALGISCADLVKAQQSGLAIAEIAQGKNVEVQTVIDAVTKAYTDALAADVSEGLITQAQSDGQLSRLTIDIGQWVYNERGGVRPGFGQPDGQGGFGHRGGPGGPNGQNGPQGGFDQHGGQGGPNGVNPPQAPNSPGAEETPVPTPNA